MAESTILMPAGANASRWKAPDEQEVRLAMNNLSSLPRQEDVQVLPGVSYGDEVARARANLAAKRPADPPPERPMVQEVAPSIPLDEIGVMGMQRQGLMGQAGNRITAMKATKQVSKFNEMHEPVQQYIGSEQQTDERVRDATSDQLSIEQQQAEQEAAAYSQEHARVQARADAVDAVEQQRRERLIAQEEQMKMIQKQYADAVEKFASAPEIDPNRFWASKSAGQRFRMTLATGLNALGGAGPQEAMAHITNAIREDIDAQKANIANLGSAAAMRGQQFAQSNTIYGDILASVQDERIADTVVENAHLESAKSKIQEIMARAAPGLVQANGAKMLAEIDKQQGANNLKLAQLSANNPRYFVKTVPVMSEYERKLQEKVLDSELKQIEESGGDIRDVLKESAKGMDPSEKVAVDRLEFEKEKELKQRTADLGKAVQDIRPALSSTRGLYDHLESGGWNWADRKTTDLTNQAIEDYGRLQTGAIISEDEKRSFKEQMHGAMRERSKQKLQILMRSLESKVEGARRAYGDDAYAEYTRTAKDRLPSLSADRTLASRGGSADALVSSER